MANAPGPPRPQLLRIPRDAHGCAQQRAGSRLRLCKRRRARRAPSGAGEPFRAAALLKQRSGLRIRKGVRARPDCKANVINAAVLLALYRKQRAEIAAGPPPLCYELRWRFLRLGDADMKYAALAVTGGPVSSRQGGNRYTLQTEIIATHTKQREKKFQSVHSWEGFGHRRVAEHRSRACPERSLGASAFLGRRGG